MKTMKRIICSFLFIGSLNAQNIAVNNLQKHINYLASDELKGRGTSSEEEIKAAKYIADEFKSMGLTPKGSDGFYFDFTFKKSSNPHDTATTNAVTRKGRNVVAFLDNKSEYTIVIGAHYDHLGLGHDNNSLDANPEGKIHNGADDNASGTAGVIELARNFTGNKKTEKYNFLFMTYSGEELGLIGSKKWCENPTIPLEKVNYMVNLDMIGRLNDTTKKLMVYGIGTSPSFDSWLDKFFGKEFDMKKDSSGIGPSDQTSFYLKNVPVLHFFTGQHSDYHKPSDDADKINYNGMSTLLNSIIKMIEFSEGESKIKFTTTRNKESKSVRWKVSMGIMPDYAFEGKGVKVDGVSEGKPAFAAGVLKGDVITQLGDVNVDGMEKYMEALSKMEKGSEAVLKVLRGKDIVELKVIFK